MPRAPRTHDDQVPVKGGRTRRVEVRGEVAVRSRKRVYQFERSQPRPEARGRIPGGTTQVEAREVVRCRIDLAGIDLDGCGSLLRNAERLVASGERLVASAERLVGCL